MTKNTIYLKKEKLFLVWNENVLHYKTDRKNISLDLNTFGNISEPLLGVIREYLTLKCNFSWASLETRFRYFKSFNNYLEKTHKNICFLSDIDKEIFSGFLAVIKSKHSLLDYCPARADFNSLRSFYFWTYSRDIKGSQIEVSRWLKDIKLSHSPEGVSLKMFDPKKGPYLRLELLAIDKFFGDELNNWGNLSSLVKTTCIAYVISRETSRRFSELIDLEVTDLYREGDTGYAYLKLNDRKAMKGGERSKAHHRISDWIYDFVAMYIKDTSSLREKLKTKLLFVHETYKVYISSHKQIYAHAKQLVNDAVLPNRLFYQQSKIINKELSRIENKKYRINLNSSRIRDTFGTHMAAIGVPLGLVATRMGHKSIETTQKYYIMLNPEIISHYLSEKTGDMFAKMAEYFSNAVVVKLTTSKPIIVMEDADSLVFGGCMDDYCNHHPRIACYGCSRLQPLITPEHKKNLAWLIRKREQIIRDVNNNKGKTEGPHIDLVLQNIDRAIAVCQYIVSQCEALKREPEVLKEEEA